MTYYVTLADHEQTKFFRTKDGMTVIVSGTADTHTHSSLK